MNRRKLIFTAALVAAVLSCMLVYMLTLNGWHKQAEVSSGPETSQGPMLSSPVPVPAGELAEITARGFQSVSLPTNIQHIYPASSDSVFTITTQSRDAYLLLGDGCWRYITDEGKSANIIAQGKISSNPIAIFMRSSCAYVAPEDSMLFRLGESSAYEVSLPAPGFNVLPLCEPFTDSFSRDSGGAGLSDWQLKSGKWTISSAPDPRFSVSPYHLFARSSQQGRLLCGNPYSREYLVKAAVATTREPSTIGLIACSDGISEMAALWTPISGWYGRLEIRVLPGGKVLWQRAMRANPDQWYEFQFAVAGGKYYFSLDSWMLASGTSPLNSGMAGLLVRGEAQFDDIAVLPLSAYDVSNQYEAGWRDVLAGERMKACETPKIFYSDYSMSEWLPIRTDWQFSGSGRRSSLRHKRTFYNDLQVDFSCGSSSGLPRFVSLFDRGEGNVRYEFHMTNALKITVLDGGETVGTVEIPVNRWPARLAFGAGLCDGISNAWVEAEGARKSVPLATKVRNGGCDIGISYTPRDLRVYSSSVRDYTFCTAPVDFERNAGNWLIASRWACSPQYSWLGGISNPLAAITSKYDLKGEFHADIYAAPLMMEYMRPGYRHPVRLFVDAQGGSSPFSGYSFRIYDNGSDVLFDAKNGHRMEQRTYSSASPHWFHNLWLSLSLGWSNGKISARNWDGREFALSSEQHEAGPISIWHVKNDFSFARICISASEFVPRKPNGLDETPPGWPSSIRLETGIHPLLANPMCFVPREPSQLDATFSKIGDASALVLKPKAWGGDFETDIVIPEVQVASYPVMRLSYKAVTKRPVTLRFKLGDLRFFVPLTAEDTAPPFDGAINVPAEYVSREEISISGSRINSVTIYLGAMALDILRLADTTLSNLEISADPLALGREDAFADTKDAMLALFALDLPEFSTDPIRLPKGWRYIGRNNNLNESPDLRLAAAISSDGRLAVFARYTSKPEVTITRNIPFGIRVDAQHSSGIAKTLVEVSVVCGNRGFSVTPEIKLRDGVRAEFQINANDLFASPDSDLADITITVMGVGGSKNTATIKGVARADFCNGDTVPPKVTVSFPVSLMEDNNAKPWLREWGGPHALYPLPINKSDRWEYIAQKKLLGGFSGMTLSFGAVDTNMYPYLVGWYCSPDNWELDILPASGAFGMYDLYSLRGVPAITTWPQRDDWNKPKPMFVDLTKLAGNAKILGEIRIGDYYFTSAQDDWGLQIGGLSLVPRIYGPEVRFNVNASDVSGISRIEHGYVYRGRSYSVEPPSIAVKMSVADSPSVSFTPVREGLHWLAVRVTDQCGNVSPVQWMPFDYAKQSDIVPQMVSYSNIGGTTEWPRSLLLKLRGISPPTVEVKVADRICTLGNGLAVCDSLSNSPTREFDIVVPWLASDEGNLDITVTGLGYNGAQFSNSFKVVRDATQITAPPSRPSVVAIPSNRLVFDDFETGTGSASGRRGALVASSQKVSYEGKRSLLVEAISNYDFFSAYLCDTPYMLNDHPFVDFDYLAGNAKMCLMVKVGGSFYDIQLGNVPVPMEREYAQVGRFRIAGNLGYSSGLIGTAKCDNFANNWNHVSVNLRKLLSAYLKISDDIRVECVAIRAASGNPIGTQAFVDNFCIWGPSSSYEVRWSHDPYTPVGVQQVMLRDKQADKWWHPSGGLLDASAAPATNGATEEMKSDICSVVVRNLGEGEYYLVVVSTGNSGNSSAEALLIGGAAQVP